VAEEESRELALAVGNSSDQSEESLGTVVVAGLANIAIGSAKAVAGVLSGSAAMLSEGAHSFADTLTEVLLFVSVRRGSRPPDERHPFGHGKSSFLWATMAALATLFVGAGFAITQGIHAIVSHAETGDYLVSYVVLAISFLLEGMSLLRAVWQLRGSARFWRVPVLRYLRRTPDTAVKAVTFEDSAALVGLVLAGTGLALSEVTGDTLWDGAASVAIGALLGVVGVVLVRANASLIIGEAPPARLRDEIIGELERVPSVERVIEVLTMYLGPRSLLVAARVAFEGSDPTRLGAAADQAEQRLRTKIPLISYVFLDPTPRPDPSAAVQARPPGDPASTV
jgi:cation diffusion facilitator family transporter